MQKFGFFMGTVVNDTTKPSKAKVTCQSPIHTPEALPKFYPSSRKTAKNDVKTSKAGVTCQSWAHEPEALPKVIPSAGMAVNYDAETSKASVVILGWSSGGSAESGSRNGHCANNVLPGHVRPNQGKLQEECKFGTGKKCSRASDLEAMSKVGPTPNMVPRDTQS
jgi:hypothetical protein